MKCAIMQPTYFPWAGYFNLISHVDFFIFLDDVQYSKNSFHNRNRYLVEGEAKWITVPVIKGKSEKKICEARIDDERPWRRKHINTLQLTYGKHPFFKDFMNLVSPIIENSERNTVAKMNTKIIETISKALGMKAEFKCTSELGISDQRSSRLIKICKQLECENYLSPAGSREYIEEDGAFSKSSIEIEYQNYKCSEYSQVNAKSGEFVSNMSIIDIFCNLGAEKALSYIKSGY